MPVFAFYTHDPGWRKGWRDKLIRWATGSVYSHVEYLTEGRVKHENVCFSASKRDGNCVRSKAITWRPGHWVFVEIEGDDADIYARFIEEMGQPYDTLGAVLSVTPFRWYRSEVWFCSEIVAFMLRWPHHWKYTPGRVFDRMIEMGGRVIQIEAHERMNRAKAVAQNTPTAEAADG